MTEPVDLLALHTAEPIGSLAVAVGPCIEHEVFATAGRHAPVLLVSVLELLRRAAISLDALAGLAVTTGPGSFTGIRIGLATAQGLAAARGWRIWACDTLTAIASARAGTTEPHAVVLDARRGEVYAGLFDVRRDVPRPLLEPFCAPPEIAAARLAGTLAALGARPGGVVLAGSGAPLLRTLDPAFPAAPPAPPPVPVAAGLLRLARAGGCRIVQAAELEPTYLRKSDAELRRDDALRTGA